MKALRVRPANATDLEFVVASWVDSYRNSHFSGPIPMPMYRDVMTASVRWILNRPGIEIWVAFKPDERPPDDLYGWVCIEGAVPMRVREWDPVQRLTVDVEHIAPIVVHYAYVKQMFREKGIAKRLLLAAGVEPRMKPVIHTFKTAIVAKLQGLGKLPGASFAPQLARYPKDPTKNEPKEIR